MHPWARLVTRMKDAGFPQALEYRDMAYLPAADQYVNVGEVGAGAEYVRVPNTVAVMSLLEDTDYTLECCLIEKRLEGKPAVSMRGYRLTHLGQTIENESIGVLCCTLWLRLRGADAG